MAHPNKSGKQAVPDPGKRSLADATRLPYSRPLFRIYGSVSKLTMGSSGPNIDGSGTHNTMKSDRRTKENVVRIGEHPLGIGLYLFDYRPQYRECGASDRQFGVMADEVEIVLPEAVVIDPDGYKMVNYAMLGISHRIQ